MVTTEMRAGVFLKPDPSGPEGRRTRLDLVCRLLGHTTDMAMAPVLGVADRTIARARKGVLGEAFIASVLRALADREEELAQYGVGVKFEDLFEIRDKAAS